MTLQSTKQLNPGAASDVLTAPNGVRFRDINHNGTMEPYEDPTASIEERVDDLLGRMTIAEKAGLMFQTVIEAGQDGTLLEAKGNISKSPTSVVISEKLMNHFNVHQLPNARLSARWANAVQALAANTRLGVPVTISTDPRHGFHENTGTSFQAGYFSQWPETIGLAALGSRETVREFAEIARQEYVAVGIRAALHPCIDLATEPRWARLLGTLGQDPAAVSSFAEEYLRGFQGDGLGTGSVACTTKHFPGGGPQKDGEDAHFPYGREQIYPGGNFEGHLEPFKRAIASGTSAIMPYYGMPVGLEIDGEHIEECGFGYNRQIIQGLLRNTLGYEGVVVTDWELVNDNWVGDQVLPARAWGVEHLDPQGRMVKILEAGCDQFGGEECVDSLLDLVAQGVVSEGRLDESARRLLRVKFALGLFDNPFVDEDAAEANVGNPEFLAAGRRAQSASVTLLKGGVGPLTRGQKIYAEGFDTEHLAGYGETVSSPEDADVIILRVGAPFVPRNDLFLEAWFHQGSLEFQPGFIARIARLAALAPVVIDIFLDRPAILTALEPHCSVITGTFGTATPAWLDVIFGDVPCKGRLPFELPRSMRAVEDSCPDLPSDTLEPLFAVGFRDEWGSA